MGCPRKRHLRISMIDMRCSMKKILSILVVFALFISLPIANAVAEAPDKLDIVCTTFPQYDWVLNILGYQAAHANVTLLLDNGVDLHSYQPTAQDIAKISSCDLFIYVGGESDGWVPDVIAAAENPNLNAISMVKCVDVQEEEVVEGMQAEEEEAPAGGAEEPEYDEHVWVSLKFAQKICASIVGALSTLDPENAATYAANADAYGKKLSDLDGRYQAAVDSAARKTVLFADRFPFRYLADDYGLTYYAAFVGCSAETEASFKTIAFLAGKIDELKLPAVLVIEGATHKIADTVIAATAAKDAKILVMNSLQSVTSEDIAAGETYLGIMEENLTALTEALN